MSEIKRGEIMRKFFYFILPLMVSLSLYGATAHYTVESGNPDADYQTIEDALIYINNPDVDIITLHLTGNFNISNEININQNFHNLTISSVGNKSSITGSSSETSICRIFNISAGNKVTLRNL